MRFLRSFEFKQIRVAWAMYITHETEQICFIIKKLRLNAIIIYRHLYRKIIPNDKKKFSSNKLFYRYKLLHYKLHHSCKKNV